MSIVSTIFISEEELREMYFDKNMTMTEIANDFDVSYSTIFKQMKSYGIKRRLCSGRLTKVSISEKELREMYIDKKMSLKKIGHEFGVCAQTVLNYMQLYNIKSRTYSESLLINSLQIPEEKLIQMYRDEKMSMAEIGKEYGLDVVTVFNMMKRYEIESRTISESIFGKRVGENNGNWKNGISFIPYCKKFNNMFREAVRKRDDYTCQLCELKQEPNGEKLSVHHIHYDKENCYPDVVALCRSCNSRVNGNRDYWEEYFEKHLLERGLFCWSISDLS